MENIDQVFTSKNQEQERKFILNFEKELPQLTNDQKLVYLSKLIQDVDQEFASSEIGKKLIKK